MAKPKNQMLNLDKRLSIQTCPEDTTKYSITPFLNEKGLHAFTLTCKRFRKQHKEQLADKKVAAELLDGVLNPTRLNQTRFQELLFIHIVQKQDNEGRKQDKKGQPLYLIQNEGEEVYFNKASIRKTKTKRYTNVLEAILRTRNFHLAIILFNCIPEIEKTEALKNYISLVKSQEMWGLPELQLAYKNLLEQFHSLCDNKKWDEIKKLYGCIGRVVKEHLPWFSIYLFCHPVTHDNADYTKAPNWTCILYDNSVLDLDLFGADSIETLCKGGLEKAFVAHGGAPGHDLEAFSKQSEVLAAELDKTIKHNELYMPEEPKSDSVKKPNF